MPIVSNTSPLLNLAIIDHLALVRAQFEMVYIPTAVRAELKIESDFPGAAQLRKALAAGWLQEVALESRSVVRALQRDLDEGEAEAIALALQRGETDILMDEHDGRAIAKTMGLQPIGVLGVLLRAKRAGTLESVQVAVRALQNEAGFHLSETLVNTLLHEAGER